MTPAAFLQTWDHKVDSYICPISSGEPGESMDKLSLRNGQACFFFSHGCTIHCDKCDGKTARFGSTCGNEKTAKATICEPHLRTLNRNATCTWTQTLPTHTSSPTSEAEFFH